MSSLLPLSQWLHLDWVLLVVVGWLIVGAAGVVAQLAENLGPVDFGQVHIEEDDVRTILLVDVRYELESFRAVFDDMQLMLDPMFFECLPYEENVSGVILGQ